MKALGLVVSDKIFESCILITYFLTPWPTFAINCFDLGVVPVCSKSNEWFQRRVCLRKLLTHTQTDGRTDNGRRSMGYHKITPWALCAPHLNLSKIRHNINFIYLSIKVALVQQGVVFVHRLDIFPPNCKDLKRLIGSTSYLQSSCFLCSLCELLKFLHYNKRWKGICLLHAIISF